jgi:hypothetical protein
MARLNQTLPAGLDMGLVFKHRDWLGWIWRGLRGRSTTAGCRETMAEGVAEVADLDVDHVLDDADEVRAGGRPGHTEVVLAGAAYFPQQRVSTGLKIVTQRRLGLFQITPG